MTEAEFLALAAQGYNRIPLVLESFADLDTPLSLYIKLANQRFTYLLESVVGGERFGRYSFIGLPAKVRIRSRGRSIEVEDRGGIVERHEGDPLAFVGEFLRRYRAAPRPGLPRFCGGVAGYFGYDTVRHIEHRLADSAPAASAALADVPDILLLLTEELAVVDNLGQISLIVYAIGGARSLRAGAGPAVGLRRKLRSRWRFLPDVDHDLASAKRNSAKRATRRPSCARRTHRGGRHHAGGPVATDEHAVRRIPVAVPRVALAQSSPYMFYYDLAISMWSARRRFSCARRARRSLRPIAGTRPRRYAGGRSAGAETGERSGSSPSM
jgi:anthranilate synthase component 1